MTKYPVIFLDRDGVIIKDVDLLTSTAQVEFYPYTTLALQKLKRAGFKLVVVTNQPVVARGLISELKVVEIHDYINSRLLNEGLVTVDQYYFCPHHPQAS